MDQRRVQPHLGPRRLQSNRLIEDFDRQFAVSE